MSNTTYDRKELSMEDVMHLSANNSIGYKYIDPTKLTASDTVQERLLAMFEMGIAVEKEMVFWRGSLDDKTSNSVFALLISAKEPVIIACPKTKRLLSAMVRINLCVDIDTTEDELLCTPKMDSLRPNPEKDCVIELAHKEEDGTPIDVISLDGDTKALESKICALVKAQANGIKTDIKTAGDAWLDFVNWTPF